VQTQRVLKNISRFGHFDGWFKQSDSFFGASQKVCFRCKYWICD